MHIHFMEGAATHDSKGQRSYSTTNSPQTEDKDRIPEETARVTLMGDISLIRLCRESVVAYIRRRDSLDDIRLAQDLPVLIHSL